jgi:hypothetical protein
MPSLGGLMRTTTLLALGAALVVAACSDNQSSPTSPRTASGSVHPANAASASLAPSPNAKPVDQVGFTKITKVVGPVVTLGSDQSGSSTATCPSGTTLTGGGHMFTLFVIATPPWVYKSADDSNNGWLVSVVVLPGANQVAFEAVAYCAS